MKKLMFLATLAIAATFTSCAPTPQTMEVVALSGAERSIKDRLIGTYHVDVLTECGDTVEALLRPSQQYDVCRGKKLTVEIRPVVGNLYVQKIN